ncbi:glycosyltransferase [Virgibacillus sp. NKC19-3]|uniref:tetratricopeptide repeat-containing glycosyltransferase family 2 protein n=1 Tax=Virgibacillus saliphilus TaxID=2831674 RepID=UPI001C9B2438|nr:glycosyltransferase [Virgibacillus sp. NKC19-3]MBY7141952.1 glycosyltransferase [Virgibacillus sp. NKC19-3]
MVTISLCMIVRNEEDVIGRCLESVKHLVDEINIIDTGSTDQTKEIAMDYTDRIYDFTWVDDFAAARNFAFEHATKDYIFWLDADDVLLEKDQRKLAKMKDTLDSKTDAVTMDYHLAFDEYANVTFSVRRHRLLKRERNFRWIGAVHEYLEVGGNIFNSDIAVTHHKLHHNSDRNLRIYESRLAQGGNFTPRDLFYFANELTDHHMFERAVYFYDKFLATGLGWLEDNITACGRLADCYLELDQPEKALQAVFRSFAYDRPRAEFCCRLGYHFLQKGECRNAIFWYDIAARTDQPKDGMGFVNMPSFTWLPHLQLCVCYDQLGDYKSAYYHNEIARSYRPEDQRILHNRQYLESVLQKNEDGKNNER